MREPACGERAGLIGVRVSGFGVRILYLALPSPLGPDTIRHLLLGTDSGHCVEPSIMRLTEILKPANIKIPLQAKTKTEAISELVNLLAVNGDVADARK